MGIVPIHAGKNRPLIYVYVVTIQKTFTTQTDAVKHVVRRIIGDARRPADAWNIKADGQLRNLGRFWVGKGEPVAVKPIPLVRLFFSVLVDLTICLGLVSRSLEFLGTAPLGSF